MSHDYVYDVLSFIYIRKYLNGLYIYITIIFIYIERQYVAISSFIGGC